MLEVNHLTVKLGRRLILKDVSFIAETGKIVALLGKNGSGKTTLLRALASDLLTSQGQIYLDGKKVSEMKEREYVNQVAFLPQTLTKPAITLEQLILFGRYPYKNSLKNLTSLEIQQAKEVLQRLHLWEKKEELVCHLSSGQRQLAYFGLLLNKDCPYNLLDEPTSNLDIEVKKSVFENLKQLKKEGKTILISLHDLNDALDLADQVVVLDQGSVLFEGTTRQFIQSSLPLKLFHCEEKRLHDEKGNEYIWYK